MKRGARILVATSVAALLVGGLSLPASAGPSTPPTATAGGFVFTAQATVSNPLWAPVAPTCGGVPCPVPTGPTNYSFNSNNAGQFGQFCAGAVVEADAHHSPGHTDANLHVGVRTQNADVANTTCQIASTGLVEASLHFAPIAGPWCGLSSGYGSVTGQVGHVTHPWVVPAGTEVVWLTSAGTVLPLVLTMTSPDLDNPEDPGHPGGNKRVVGGGAVQTTGAEPGVCGLRPPDFDPTTAFTVTGFTAFAAVDLD